MPSDNVENFVIDSIRVFSINNDPLYVNYNINNTKIDALVENDGVPGKLFIVKFIFPNGITPLSISPDISKPVDFKNPVTFEIQYSTAIKKLIRSRLMKKLSILQSTISKVFRYSMMTILLLTSNSPVQEVIM